MHLKSPYHVHSVHLINPIVNRTIFNCNHTIIEEANNLLIPYTLPFYHALKLYLKGIHINVSVTNYAHISSTAKY